jgi:acetylornithine/N-succinyldiaminopimelate aminotransferase
MALAKALGGGFPVGACLATLEAAKGMTAGTHGSTFGGNPLAMSVASAVLDVVLEPGFLDRVRQAGLLLKQRLAEIKDRYPSVISEVRGEGLLIGLRTGRLRGRCAARRAHDRRLGRRQCHSPSAALDHQ